MSAFDIVLLIILILSAIKGYVKGFIVEFFSFIAFFLGLFFAVSFTSPIALKYFGESHYFEVISITIFIVLFIGTLLLVNLLSKLIKKAIGVTFLGIIDNILGALFGVAKWALIFSVFIWTLKSIGLELPSKYTDNSFLYAWISAIAPVAFEFIGSYIPFFRDIFEKMEGFDRKTRMAWIH